MSQKQHALPDFIQGAAGRLEYDWIPAKNEIIHTGILALVCHPHPQHGGTKDNKVVHTLCRAWRDSGIDCLRFNFRGVGKSEGEYGAGQGELEDLLSVVKFVRNEMKSEARLIVSGFSFGASIAARYAANNPVFALVLVAPPVRYPELTHLKKFSAPVLVVQGQQDDLVEYADVVAWTENVVDTVQFEVLSEAGHFFHGQQPELKTAVQKFAQFLVKHE